MPKIPTYTRKVLPPGESGNALMNVAGAGAVGESVQRLGNTGVAVTNEFANLIATQQEDLRKRRATVENASLTNKANNFLTEQKIAYDAQVNAAQSPLELADYSKKHTEAIQSNFHKLIGIDKISDPDILTHAQKLAGDVDTNFRDHSAVAQQKALGIFASKEIDAAALIAVNNAKAGQTPEDSLKSVTEIIGNMNKAGTINIDKATELTVKAQQAVVASYIDGLTVSDPAKAVEVIKSGKYNNMMTEADYRRFQGMATKIDTLRAGMDAGVKIFKDDKTGSIEQMTDKVRALKLDPETEKTAISQVKELYNERKTDEARIRVNAAEEVNAILVPIALKRNGINKPSDLSPAQWAKLTKDNPEYAQKLQASMRRELDYQARLNKQDAAAAKQEKRIAQSENESLILLSDDFATRDLKKDLSLGDISAVQYNKLLTAQQKLDPIKRDSVKTALSKVNSGSALGKAIGVKGNEEAVWKLKYGELVKAWAYNHADDPDFDRKMTEFVEKQVLSDMVTSWFAGDESDRIDRFQAAKKEAGELPQKGKGKKIVGYKDGKPVYDAGNGKWQVGD